MVNLAAMKAAIAQIKSYTVDKQRAINKLNAIIADPQYVPFKMYIISELSEFVRSTFGVTPLNFHNYIYFNVDENIKISIITGETIGAAKLTYMSKIWLILEMQNSESFNFIFDYSDLKMVSLSGAINEPNVENKSAFMKKLILTLMGLLFQKNPVLCFHIFLILHHIIYNISGMRFCRKQLSYNRIVRKTISEINHIRGLLEDETKDRTNAIRARSPLSLPPLQSPPLPPQSLPEYMNSPLPEHINNSVLLPAVLPPLQTPPLPPQSLPDNILNSPLLLPPSLSHSQDDQIEQLDLEIQLNADRFVPLPYLESPVCTPCVHDHNIDIMTL